MTTAVQRAPAGVKIANRPSYRIVVSARLVQDDWLILEERELVNQPFQSQELADIKLKYLTEATQC